MNSSESNSSLVISQIESDLSNGDKTSIFEMLGILLSDDKNKETLKNYLDDSSQEKFLDERPFYKHTVTFEMITDEHFDSDLSINDMLNISETGSGSGKTLNYKVETIDRKNLIERCEDHGSEPHFFSVDHSNSDL